MVKISYAGCFGLSPATSLQCTFKMCAAAKNCKNIRQKAHFWGSRSFKVIDVDKTKKPVNSACYDKQHACRYLQPFLHETSE